MSDTTEVGEDRILTVPNVITMVRLACLPLFVWLLFGTDNEYAAAWLLGALGATDWVDGFIARRWKQVSTLGKVLDPVADRLLLFVGIGCILIEGAVPIVVATLVLVREVLISLATIGLAALGARRIDVTWFGKAGTFCNLFAFPFFLAGGDEQLGWRHTATALGWVFAVPGILLSWYALALYVPIALRALREGRAKGVGTAP
ncbi:MAG TPA: CDP-alcohol phosphatidyltransferase family protein [Acidimicrobiales bacterium]|nr:CDP-alcohol phosphatidyltransferase family protein [Acidimicrobiales bacterium]